MVTNRSVVVTAYQFQMSEIRKEILENKPVNARPCVRVLLSATGAPIVNKNP